VTVGALQMHPLLRDNLTIVRRESHGKVHYIVKEPVEGKYSQFGEAEITLMNLMDGSRTPEQIADEAGATLGGTLDPGTVADFAQKLKRLGLVERTPNEQHLMLMERIRSNRKIRARGRTKGSILRMRFSIGDPDRLFDRWIVPLRWMWAPAFVWASVAMFLALAVLVIMNWQEFFAGAWAVSTGQAGARDYVLLYVVFLFVGTIHEFGHGLTTKRFGGEVHEIGGMLLYFTPALFCNTNDAWLFERRAHRLWVTAAGPWIQLILAFLAAVAWLMLEHGTLVSDIAFAVVLIGAITGLVGNMNPLIPLDGYYALSDYLEVPNLRGRAFGYWGWLLKTKFMGLDASEPPVTPRERRIFLNYGGLAIAYSLFSIFVGVLWLTVILRGMIGPWAWVLIALLVGRGVWRRRGRLQELTTFATTSLRARFSTTDPRKWGWAGGGVLLLIFLLFVLPWSFRANGSFVVEGTERVLVTARVDGVLERVNVEEGDIVVAGDPLATLWNPRLAADVADVERRAEELRLAEARARATGDLRVAASSGAVLDEVNNELNTLRDQRERLLVRAPIDGVVVGYRLSERVGEALKEGDLLLELDSVDGRTARVRVPIKEAGRIATGQRAGLKISTWPGTKWVSTVTSVAPAAQHGWVEAVVPFPQSDRMPLVGMNGAAKIVTDHGSVGEFVFRKFRHTVRLDLWL